MFKKVAIALALSSAAATGVHAQETPEPVKIGIIDTAVEKTLGHDDLTTIHRRGFSRPGYLPAKWNVAAQVEHGTLMATAFRDQVRSMDRKVPIDIYSATTFDYKPGHRNRMQINFGGAISALHWFKENDVKVVLTTFVGDDSKDMQRFKNEATKLGLVVFASGGNQMKSGKLAFPAAYDEFIAIAGTNEELALRKDTSQAKWVDFALDGKMTVTQGMYTIPDMGSSMATARAAAIGSYMVVTGKASDVQSIRDGLQAMSQPRKVAGLGRQQDVVVSYVDHGRARDLLDRLPRHSLARSAEGAQTRISQANLSAQSALLTPGR